MKHIITLALVGLLTGCMTYIPTPDMAMSWNPSSDSRKWQSQFVNGNPSGFIMEFVPTGQSINSWEEMMANQIVFTQLPLSQFTENWKTELVHTDPAAKLTETQNKDGSITISYSSIKANETGIRRFIKANDGIYMVAYHARPESNNDDNMAIWREIISKAKLIPNPEKR